MNYDNSTTREEISALALKWALKTFGPTFKFRPKQKDTIVDIIYNWLNNTDNIILDAPTGSGKSIVAIIVGGVLSEYFGKKGYILISDLSLLEQYRNDIEMYLPEWAVLKGQQTYTCIVNNLNFNVGVCKLKGCKSYADIKASFPDCAPYCEYIVEREKAIAAPVTVCTYSFWLIQQNYVRPKFDSEGMSENAPFGKRDFVICDEAHKLVSIVQNHFSPKFGKEDEHKFESIINESTLFEKDNLKKKIKKLRQNILNSNDNDTTFNLLKEYFEILCTLLKESQKIKDEIGNSLTKSDSGRLSKNDRTLLYICEFIKDHHCKFDDYCNIISRIGSNYIVKNDSAGDGTITFNCLNESYLMNKTFHSNCIKKLYMSATIGEPSTFAKNNSFKEYKSIKLPIIFDYTNSPIYYIPEYKMSYREKEYSFPKIIEMIECILNIYPNQRGIIQTGSYSFAKQLYDNISSKYRNRLLLYEDSTGKQDNLDTYKYSTNKILIGPSLIEGLSLNDDLCRFQIIMKIPYPSLADKFIAAKQQFNPIWYSEATSISMLQGIGRGVRNENDWCVTFVLDGCFTNLLQMTGYMFPEEFKNRIQVIPSSSLLSYKN